MTSGINVVLVVGAALTGGLAGIPMASIAYAAPAHGRLHIPNGWWRGTPARPAAVAATSLLSGAGAALIGGLLPPSPALPAFWIFAVAGVGLAIIDVRQHRLPHVLTGALWAVCILCFVAAAALAGTGGPLLRALIAGSATSAALLIVALAFPGQLGLGDVTLAGVVALNLAWLSWQAAVTGLVSGFLIQGVVTVATTSRTRREVVPMGPALVTGWFIAVWVTYG